MLLVICIINASLKKEEWLTDGRCSSHIPVVRKWVGSCPVAVDGDSNQTQDWHCAQNHQNWNREKTSVEISWKANAGQDSKRDSKQSHEKVSYCQSYDVIIPISSETPVLAEDVHHQGISDNG